MTGGNKKPEAADVHIGRRVQERRRQLGLSQEKLGEQLGITFQQVQKYEKGANRIGAGRLFGISTVLGTPVGYFFDGLKRESTVSGFGEEEQPSLDGPPAGEAARLLADFQRIADSAVRNSVLELVHALAMDSRSSAPRSEEP